MHAPNYKSLLLLNKPIFAGKRTDFYFRINVVLRPALAADFNLFQ